MNYKAGFVSFIGLPNAGKSTLMNALLQQKISIVSHKVQTTRHRIHGIWTQAQFQAVLVDTPGIHFRGGNALNRQLNKTAQAAMQGVDVVCWVVDAKKTDDWGAIASLLCNVQVPVLLLVNKIDLFADKHKLLPVLNSLSECLPNAHAFLPISATTAQGFDQLEHTLCDLLPLSPPIFDEDAITDRSTSFLISEIVREKLTIRFHDELPYGISVLVEEFIEEAALIRIKVRIFVERKTQKIILLSDKGTAMKWVGKSAREDIEKLLDKKIFLQTWVSVSKGWADNQSALNQLGYE